jgi:hypothetical protein
MILAVSQGMVQWRLLWLESDVAHRAQSSFKFGLLARTCYFMYS